MSTYLVTRHPGAVAWARQRGVQIDEVVTHLDPDKILPGDAVIGTLPVALAAEVCARGANYLHLGLDVPESLRGVELSVEQMCRFGARLERYQVERVAHSDNDAIDSNGR